MKLTIVLAGVFAALSLAAPAWAETGESGTSAGCDLSSYPAAIFNAPVKELGTTPVSLDDGSVTFSSERDAYAQFRTGCLGKTSASYRSTNEKSMTEAGAIRELVKEAELLLSANYEPGSAYETALRVYLSKAVPSDLARRNWGMAADVLRRIGNAVSSGSVYTARDIARAYEHVSDFDALKLPGDAPTLPEGTTDPTGVCTASADDTAAALLDAQVANIDLSHDAKMAAKERADRDGRVAQAVLDNPANDADLVAAATKCEMAVKTYIDALKADGLTRADLDLRLADLFYRLWQHGDGPTNGVAGVARRIYSLSSRAIIEAINDADLVTSLEVWQGHFASGGRLPENSPIPPKSERELPLEPSPS